MVDVTITQLLSIPEVFSKLDPSNLAQIMTPTVKRAVFGGLLPSFIMRFFLRKTSKGIITDIENVSDIENLAISGLTDDPAVLGNFFQKIAAKELDFLVNSGLSFGFLLGILQTMQLMVFP